MITTVSLDEAAAAVGEGECAACARGCRDNDCPSSRSLADAGFMDASGNVVGMRSNGVQANTVLYFGQVGKA